MRSLAILALLVLSVSFLYTGCKQADEVVEESEQMHEQSEKEFDENISNKVAPEVWDLVQTENYKLNWKNWPDKKNIYVNPIAFEAIESSESEFPIGSTIVREKYSAEGNLDKVVVVSRIGGNEKTKGWFSANYTPDGEVIRVNKNVINIRP